MSDLINMPENPEQHELKQKELLKQSYGLKFYSAAIFVCTAALLVDSLLSDVSSFVNQSVDELSRKVLFSTIVAIAILSGYRVVAKSASRIRDELLSRSKSLFSISKIVPAIQYTIMGLLILTTLQIILASQYLSIFLIISLALSWSTGVVLMGILAFKFIRWYHKKRSALILLYFISSAMFCSTLGSTIIPQILITLQTAPVFVNSQSTEVKFFQASPELNDTLFSIISIANWLVIPLSFVVWAATALMLSRYSRMLGRTKYWIMLSAPLASIVIGDVSLLVLLPSITTIFDPQVILYTMMAFGGMLATGFLLAFAFIVISRSIEKTVGSRISKYLGISATGIALLFVSFFANPSAGSYLPFGALSASFYGLGAYLFFFGIYTSAISISSESGLRQLIRLSLLDQSKLLDNIAVADINTELEKQVIIIARKYEETIREETGVSSSFSELDMKNYVQQLMTEIQKAKEGKSSEKE